MPSKSVMQFDWMSTNFFLRMISYVVFDQKMTLFCRSNCIAAFYKENMPDSSKVKIDTSDHSVS